MRWVDALKIWNAEHNPSKYCVVRKGTPEYDQVKRIQMGEKAAPSPTPQAAPEPAPEAAAPKPKKMIRPRLIGRKLPESEEEIVGVCEEEDDELRIHMRNPHFETAVLQAAKDAKARGDMRERDRLFECYKRILALKHEE